MRCSLTILAFVFCLLTASAQEFDISGTVRDSISGKVLEGVFVVIGENIAFSDETNSKGQFSIHSIRGNIQSISFLKQGYETRILSINPLSVPKNEDYLMRPLSIDLPAVEVREERKPMEMVPMPSVKGTGIYRGMKSEVIKLENITANLSTNNSRQVYNRIAGLNIWENDGAGIQLGIGARGLSPNRTSNFNVRQNLHDISADALGYPESYYTPALQGVERIELVRGAAGLQYGTQFGGLLNFQMKSPPPKDSTILVVDQNFSSFGLGDSINSPLASTSSFVSIGHGGKRTGVYAYYQYKQGQGWRERSDFDVHTAFATVQHQLSDDWEVSLDLTHMSYLAEQPGGLTDKEFDINPRLTKRFRNWFKVDWNIAALSFSYSPSSHLTLETKTFGLHAGRQALGHLGQIQRPDPMQARDLIDGAFDNVGNETRVLHRSKLKHGYLINSGGFRFYKGHNQTRQGQAAAGDEAAFDFDQSVVGSFSDYEFPNWNMAAFAQSLVPLTKRFSITPGLRYEYIDTQSDGSFRNIIRDGADNVLEDTLLFDQRSSVRDFVLLGIGGSYKWKEKEVYLNLVQNYRAINFTDIQVRNTSLAIDPDIQDERGYNADVGLRGKLSKHIQIDMSAFALIYNNRIGEYFTTDNLNRSLRYRSNVSDARTLGIESYIAWDISQIVFAEENDRLSFFVNTSYIDAQYIDSEIAAFDGKRVELVPEFMLRAGLDLKVKQFSCALQYSRVSSQFSDATNVGSNPDFPSTPNAVDGLIPAYQIMDISGNYVFKSLQFNLSCNNILNSAYFTRRASGYPGPGILPSDGRSLHLGVKWMMGL